MTIYSGFSHKKMVIFHSYVSLPEGRTLIREDMTGYITRWIKRVFVLENRGFTANLWQFSCRQWYVNMVETILFPVCRPTLFFIFLSGMWNEISNDIDVDWPNSKLAMACHVYNMCSMMEHWRFILLCDIHSLEPFRVSCME